MLHISPKVVTGGPVLFHRSSRASIAVPIFPGQEDLGEKLTNRSFSGDAAGTLKSYLFSSILKS